MMTGEIVKALALLADPEVREVFRQIVREAFTQWAAPTPPRCLLTDAKQRRCVRSRGHDVGDDATDHILVR
jgi:hypothetical protein